MSQAEIEQKIKSWGASMRKNPRSKEADKKLVSSKAVNNADELQRNKLKSTKVTLGTFKRLLNWVGGIKVVLVLTAFQFALHYMDLYSTSMRGFWAKIDEQ